jgi:hypothetical protein
LSLPQNVSLPKFSVAWLLGSLVTYVVLGFLKNFYTDWALVLWGALAQTLVMGLGYYLIRETKFDVREHGLTGAVALAAFLFAFGVIWMLNQFPSWYDVRFFLLPASAWFVALILLSAGWMLAALAWFREREERFLSSRFFVTLRDNLPGLLLALAFFIVYFSLAVTYSIVLRDPTQNFDDNFYDADPTSWMNRFAAPAAQLIDMRPVHPFAFLIFRPLTWLLGLLLNGNHFYAALLLNAGAGALCVFLAWTLVRRWTNPTYAALFASVLGVSAAHLVFSTFLETYIFSATALTAFLLALQQDGKPLKALVPLGLLTFGITITNFLQTGILFLFSEFKLPKLIKYGLIVTALAFPLAWLQHTLYPTSQPFYDLAVMRAENRYSANVNTPERLYERAYVMGRTVTLYSLIGPRPLALTEDLGCKFPCFKTYKPRYGPDLITSYAGFGSWLTRAWFVILILAFGLFVWKFVKSPKTSLLEVGLLLCILFNFAMHVAYGDDPMLYSPDWTYALVFFVVLAFRPFADKKWFQAAGLIFLSALMANNWTFLRAMLAVVAPYL